MKCKLPIKQIKIKEVLVGVGGGGGACIWLHLIVLSFPRLASMNYRLFFISKQHYCIILVASLKKVYSCILGRVVTIRLILTKDKTLVAKKELQYRLGSRILQWGVNFCNNVIEPKPGWGEVEKEGGWEKWRGGGGVKIHPFHLPWNNVFFSFLFFWRLSHKDNPLRNLRHSFSTYKWSFRGPEFRQIYLYSIANITSAASSLKFRKYCYQRSYFATGICKAATETQSIGIHDVYLFNTKLAMHYRAIFKYGWFRLFCFRRETSLPCFGPYFSW